MHVNFYKTLLFGHISIGAMLGNRTLVVLSWTTQNNILLIHTRNQLNSHDWCLKRDSNSQTLRCWLLRPVCIPIPPFRHNTWCS